MKLSNALTVKQYLYNKEKRATSVYISGKVKKTVIGGKEYTDEELGKVYPIHLRIIRSEELRLLKGFNKDATKIER